MCFLVYLHSDHTESFKGLSLPQDETDLAGVLWCTASTSTFSNMPFPLGTEHHKFDYCLYQSRSHLRMLLEVGPAQGETSRPGFDCDLSRREIEEMERRGGCVFIWLFPCHFNKCRRHFFSFFLFFYHSSSYVRKILILVWLYYIFSFKRHEEGSGRQMTDKFLFNTSSYVNEIHMWHAIATFLIVMEKKTRSTSRVSICIHIRKTAALSQREMRYSWLDSSSASYFAGVLSRREMICEC